jgi:hypothetical protein
MYAISVLGNIGDGGRSGCRFSDDGPRAKLITAWRRVISILLPMAMGCGMP